MTVQRSAMLFGVIFVLVGILGFWATGMDMTADPDTAPKLIGVFPVNALHNVVHILFGVWGIFAARSFSGAKSYATIAGVLYLGLAVLGWFVPDTFGLIPIGGSDIALHTVLGLALALVGFTAKERSGDT